MAEAGFYSAPMGPAGPKKKMEKVPKTMRFSVQLSDSDELSCPEFSWLKLLREAAENDEQKMLECLDPFAAKDLEEQKKLEALARTFEEKYKNYNTGKKKKKIKFQDLLDVGDGYDETDPFVDNSEAYDELVPETLTTKLGGFYINSGQLDFKELPVDRGEDEVEEEEAVVKKKKRKLTIESDSEEESSSASEMIKKKKKLFKKALKEAAKSSDSDAAGPKKPPKLVKQDKKRVFTGNMLLKRQKLEKAKKLKKAALDTRTPTKIPKKPQENGVPKPNLLHGNKLAETMDDTFAEVLGYSKPESPAKVKISVTPKSSPLKNGDAENGEKLGPESAPPLPEMIPSMKSAVEEIKQTARACKDGKQKFFNDDVNRLLLNIELGSRQHTCSQRSTIYQHLAAFLPCSKETLLKRAKKLRESDHGDKLKDPKEKLRQAIERVMPDQIERYEERVKAASAAARWNVFDYLSEELKEMEDATKDASAARKEEGSTPDSEEEEKSGEDKKKVNMPRRRFNWTPEIRRLLCELVEAKMSLLETSKNKTQTAEEYLKSYLDTEIRQLWPKGWMQTRMLYKESKPAHGPWTSGKMKKNPAITKVTGIASTNSSSNSKPKTEPKTEVKTDDDIFDFPEDEFGDAKPEVDVSSMLSSFLDSEVFSNNMDNVKTKPVTTKPKEKQREEVVKPKDVPKQPKSMPPPKASMSEHSFMAQFEKFMKQASDEKRSPEKPTNSFSAPTMAMASPSRSPVTNPLNLSSSASQSPRDESSKKYFQTPPETIDLRTPPRVQHNTGPSALSPPVVRDMLSPSGPVSDYMNSFAKFTQQQQQQHSPTKSPQLTPPKRIWSPAANPVSYSSPQNMAQAQNYSQQKIQRDSRNSIGGTMSTGNGLGTGSSHNMATGNHSNMSGGSSMQTGSGRLSTGSGMGLQAGSSPMATPLSGSPRERSMYGMYSTEQYRQQYLEQQAAQAAAAMAANAMKGSPSMYGLPTSGGMGLHSPQHAPLSPQGLYPGHRSPSASPQRHPMLQQHARHPYSQYAQDKQPRPY